MRGGNFIVSWWQAGLDQVPSASLFLTVCFCHSLSPPPSVPFCHCHRVSLLSFPSSNLSPHQPGRPCLSSRSGLGALPPPRCQRLMDARSGRCSGERLGLPCRLFHPRWRPESPREEEQPQSSQESPVASNPINAREIITPATNARSFQPFQGAATAGDTGQPGSPAAPGSQRTPGAFLVSEEEARNRRHPEAHGCPREELSGTGARSFQN